MTTMTTTSLQRQACALGDPTRHAIFRHLADAGRPLGIAELNEYFPFNHNAIRQHLAKLLGAGLLREDKAPATRGRPPLVYEIDPAVEGTWGTTGPCERLSRLLLEVIRSGLGPDEVGRRAADAFRIAEPSGDVVADMTAAMARQGFQPETRDVRGGNEIVLHNCPFAAVALADRTTICSRHLGIAEGLAGDDGVRVIELVAYDPRDAQCRIRVQADGHVAGGDTDPKPSLRGRARRR